MNIEYMNITLSTDAIRNISDTTLLALGFLGYLVGATVYYLIKGHFVGNLLTEQIQLFGNLSRVTHVISYMFLGYVFTDRFITIMLIGVGWELVEWTLSSLMRDPYWGVGQDYACDIIANATGFLIGYMFNQTSLSSRVRS